MAGLEQESRYRNQESREGTGAMPWGRKWSGAEPGVEPGVGDEAGSGLESGEVEGVDSGGKGRDRGEWDRGRWEERMPVRGREALGPQDL